MEYKIKVKKLEIEPNIELHLAEDTELFEGNVIPVGKYGGMISFKKRFVGQKVWIIPRTDKKELKNNGKTIQSENPTAI